MDEQSQPGNKQEYAFLPLAYFLKVYHVLNHLYKFVQHIARQGENVLANLTQYGLRSKYLDVVVGDSSLPLWRSEWKFDAIITDREFIVKLSFDRLVQISMMIN